MTVPSQNILTVNPIPSLSDEVNDVRLRTAKIVADYVIPQEKILAGYEGDEKKIVSTKSFAIILGSKVCGSHICLKNMAAWARGF
ncbi:MAG: hypothetical protein V7708_11460 [Oceanicoccus sp.]